MPELTPPTVPPPVPPFPPEFGAERAPQSGCLKWGVVVFASLSALLIVGLVVFYQKKDAMLDWAFSKMSEPVLAACTREVSPADRQDFQAAFRHFSEEAKRGHVTPSQIQDFQKKATAALADGRVTPDELQGLTRALKEMAP